MPCLSPQVLTRLMRTCPPRWLYLDSLNSSSSARSNSWSFTRRPREMRCALKPRTSARIFKSWRTEIDICYLGDGNGVGRHLFAKLAKYFDGDTVGEHHQLGAPSVLASFRVLLEVFGPSGTRSTTGDPQADFLASFGMSRNSATAFSVLIHKLQDLLSRAEHFEVLTVNNSASESSRSSSTSMLSKQLRLKLTADADSDIPTQLP